MAMLVRVVIVTVLALLLVFEGAVGRVAAAPPAGSDAPAPAASPSPEEEFPTWAKWTLAGVAIAAGVALLLAFVIVPALVEETFDDADACCPREGNGSNDGGLL